MLFNPTPMEKLSTLTQDLMNRHNTLKEELENLRHEMVSERAQGNGKDEEIEHLNELLRQKDAEISAKNSELAEKDAEIEAIIAKIESIMG